MSSFAVLTRGMRFDANRNNKRLAPPTPSSSSASAVAVDGNRTEKSKRQRPTSSSSSSALRGESGSRSSSANVEDASKRRRRRDSQEDALDGEEGEDDVHNEEVEADGNDGNDEDGDDDHDGDNEDNENNDAHTSSNPARESDDKQLRSRLGIKVRGRGQLPAPWLSFDEAWSAILASGTEEGGEEKSKSKSNSLLRRRVRFLQTNVEGSRFKEPTPVQMQAMPVMVSGRDVLAVAPTGSGKTAAFVIPALLAPASLGLSAKPGIHALVIVPTHELADQIVREATWLSAGSGVKCVSLSAKSRAGVVAAAAPTAQKSQAQKEAKEKETTTRIDLLVATPLLLLEMIRSGDLGDAMRNLQMLILDEADRLFEMGFLEQLDEILEACSPETPEQVARHQRAMFSATMPPRVEALAESVLRDAVHVAVGSPNAAADTIDQQLVFCGNEEGKLVAVRRLISEGALPPPCFIFVQTVTRAKQLAKQLAGTGAGFSVDALHGEKSASERDRIVMQFRRGKLWYLVATEVVARGVDFRGTNSVLNYDFPGTAVAYIHRVGRCGRAGRSGKAVTFFVEEDVARLRTIANVVRASGCQVPEWMLQLKKPSRVERKRHAPAIRELVGGGYVRQKKRAERRRLRAESGSSGGGVEEGGGDEEGGGEGWQQSGEDGESSG